MISYARMTVVGICCGKGRASLFDRLRACREVVAAASEDVTMVDTNFVFCFEAESGKKKEAVSSEPDAYVQCYNNNCIIRHYGAVCGTVYCADRLSVPLQGRRDLYM